MTTSDEDDDLGLEGLLPFYVNGTLDADDRARVDAALAEDADLAAQLAVYRSMSSDVTARETANTPGEFGLARLMRDIDAEEKTTPPQIQMQSPLWRYAAAVALALLVLQTAVVMLAPDQGFELAGGGTGAGDGPALTVAFRSDATEAQIRDALLGLDLEIVSGPSAIGLYTLRALDDQAAAEAVSQLDQMDDLIESVELED